MLNANFIHSLFSRPMPACINADAVLI